MSYDPTSLPQPQPTPPYYAVTPPAPPPKPSSAEQQQHQGPPLPPPPPNYNEPLELDGRSAYDASSQQPRRYASPPQQQQLSIPPIEPGWLPESIQDKSTSDLHHLLSNTTLQTSLLSAPATTHPSIPASHSALTPLLDANLHLSNTLLTLEQTLSQKRAQTQSRLLALKALERQHRAKLEETESALQQWSPMALYQRLSASVGEQENLVRGVEESWMEDVSPGGDGGAASSAEVEAFVKRVKEGRKLAFLRRERKGRWDEGRVGGWR